jgi:iron complex outermembrane recepter protein
MTAPLLGLLALALPAVQDTVPVRIGGITIVATADSAARRAPQPVAVLEGAALRTAQGASLGDALAGLPGLRSLSMTTGIGKPVIRGLHSTRIVTLDGGQRVESQQWGADHAPIVETQGAERIQVVKGPASVRYGSDALGGVIDVVRRPLMDARGHQGWLGERALTLSYNSAIAAPDATLSVDAARGRAALRATVTGRQAGDMRTPGGPLPNTDARAVHGELVAGWRGDRVHTELTAITREDRISLLDDPVEAPGFTGYQRLSTERLRLVSRAPVGDGTLEATLGWERNYRREFEAADDPTVALGLLATTSTAVLDWHHQRGRWQGTVGAFAMHGRFDKRGEETLIPSSSTEDLALYVTESGDFGRVAVSAGLRYDRRALHAADDAVLGLRAETRRFDAVTGALGGSVTLGGPLTLAVNLGRGFRAPTASELYANGFHEGTRAYERGDPTVGVETSLSSDVALRWRSPRLRAEVSAYDTRIDGYLYLRPFGTGPQPFDSLAVMQGDAVLRGLEGELQWAVHPRLTLRGSGDLVRGTNVTADLPLFLMPPPRATGGARLELPGRGPLLRPHLAVDVERHARATRLDPRDVAFSGYGLLHLRAGTALTVGPRLLLLDLAVTNATDRRYRDHLSRYKTFAEGLGRAVVLRVTTRW